MARILRNLAFMSPGCCAAGVLFFLLLRPRRKRLAAMGLTSNPVRETAMLLLWMFAGGMAVITLSPEPGWLFFGLQGDWTPFFNLWGIRYRVSLVPFSDLDSLYNIIGNIVMFLPFGFFTALLWRRFTWMRALALGLGITCFIECWQMLVGRTSDIDDVILNTLGVFGGYLLWALLQKLAPEYSKGFHVWKF